ncbi:hypothetical protein EVAR_14785_1 [Eumeta japonica]|uniref:Uncharacterized protein n=1 Tax=Eumeta variegata TaxID=151549 RepID=A0A4C1TWJ3_EUMVA|nr:hypothetical protein EVAR_14785_1 [Eumeta japonica]
MTRALSAATESRNSLTKIKPNTPHSAYHVARSSVRLTCVPMYNSEQQLLVNRWSDCCAGCGDDAKLNEFLHSEASQNVRVGYYDPVIVYGSRARRSGELKKKPSQRNRNRVTAVRLRTRPCVHWTSFVNYTDIPDQRLLESHLFLLRPAFSAGILIASRGTSTRTNERMGPSSAQILRGALRPVCKANRCSDFFCGNFHSIVKRLVSNCELYSLVPDALSEEAGQRRTGKVLRARSNLGEPLRHSANFVLSSGDIKPAYLCEKKKWIVSVKQYLVRRRRSFGSARLVPSPRALERDTAANVHSGGRPRQSENHLSRTLHKTT